MGITTEPTVQVGGNGMDGFGGGMWGGNRGPAYMPTGDQAPVSSAQFQSGMNMQNLSDQNRDILNATNNVYHGITANLDNRYSELQRDIAANAVGIQQVQANSQQCCCQIKQEIAAQTLKFSEMLNAQNMLLMQENQKTRDMFWQDKTDRLAARVNSLERQADLAAALNARMPLPPPFPQAVGF